jgi:predicted ATPase
MSQQVSNLLLSSGLDDSQIAIITEATIKLAGGNPLFTREITISAVELLKDFITPNPQTGSSRSQESIADATLNHIINSLHPHHRIEEIISLRFDRLSPSHQLVLKVASVIGKDGAVFTADAVSHVIKELSTYATSARSTVSRELSASINVEEVLDKILELDDFIKIKIETVYSSSSIYGNENKKAVKYKFKNVLIENSVYDIMLNHQKTWSHQKVAEYLEAKFLLRIEQLAAGSFEYDSDEETDGCSVGTILPYP